MAVIRHLGVAFVLLVGLSAHALAQQVSQPVIEVLDFEELVPTCVARVTRSDWGAGPIWVHGRSPRGWRDTNVAVVIDTKNPGNDRDLEIPRYGNALIVSKNRPYPPKPEEKAWSDGYVDFPTDDESIPFAVLSFEFDRRDTASVGPVTFYGLSLLDHDDAYPAVIHIHGEAPELRALFEGVPPPEPDPETGEAASPHLDLFYRPRSWWRDWLAPERRSAVLNPPDAEHDYYRLQIAPIPSPGKASEIEVRELRGRGRESRAYIGKEPRLTKGISGVIKIEVKLGGSAAVDRLEFARGAKPKQDGSFVGLFKQIQPYLTKSVQPELEELRDEYVQRWVDLGQAPPSDVRPKLQQSLDDLEADLLGRPADPETNFQGERGILDCKELHSGCPQLRPLRAWVKSEIAGLRSLVANAEGEELRTPYEERTANRAAIQLAALAPAAFLDQAEGPGSGTFWKQFVNKGREALNVAADKLANLFHDVKLEEQKLAAGAETACSSYGVIPKDETADELVAEPDETIEIPRGLYCVYCRSGNTNAWELDFGLRGPDWAQNDLCRRGG